MKAKPERADGYREPARDRVVAGVHGPADQRRRRVKLLRLIGTLALPESLDPFWMLDAFGRLMIPKPIGFYRIPTACSETVTDTLAGRLRHRDKGIVGRRRPAATTDARPAADRPSTEMPDRQQAG